ncbi:L,D-transpeptidase family protein [Sphingomonas sp. BN140010]|uniref:L,D-transpeptidase family protein n=1 Tax=Sphingomonas arvum TaxID=2992113 RepID=A0ABT3JBN6_9SPHN|nr:L,D-transpeptidase family protein [Sphingomonas sp. BN140010]MCW3796483.1 L,D-transpeptidase family protein [Sphingomonas sp. BN140010]
MQRLTAGAAFAAALISLVPAVASAATSAELAPAASVERFMGARRQQPLWLADPAATELLVDRLRTARLDGFARGPELAEAARAALAKARTGDRRAAREAERLLTSSWILYVQALRWPAKGVEFADPRLAPAIPVAADVLRQLAAAPSLASHVRAVSTVNPTYAALREAAIAAGDDQAVLARLRPNLDRARMLPADGRFILVDLASQHLTMMEDGQAVDTMKVVVGKTEMPTPLLAGTVARATFNPYWNIPVDLVAHTVAPGVLKNGLRWFAGKHYEALSGWGPDAQVLDPAQIDWQAVADGRTELRVRQRPGRGNMMGAMKFEFPNTHGIYLHDTPERALFAKSVRTFSSGCVRLEDAARLGRWLLGREPVADSSQPELTVALPRPVPVYITYLTAKVENGRLAFSDDIYGLDAKAEQRLASQ